MQFARSASSIHNAVRWHGPRVRPTPPLYKCRDTQDGIQKSKLVRQRDSSQIEGTIQLDLEFTQSEPPTATQQEVRQHAWQTIKWLVPQFRLGVTRRHRTQGDLLKPAIAALLAQRSGQLRHAGSFKQSIAK